MNNPSILALSEINQEERHVSCSGETKSGCSPPPRDVGQGSQRHFWGAARAHLSLLTCSTPQGAAAEMGIFPRCCRTQGGM